MSHLDSQHHRAMVLREKVRQAVVDRAGVTTLDVCAATAILRPTAAGHLKKLADAKIIKMVTVGHRHGGTMAVWYAIDAVVLPYQRTEEKQAPAPAPLADDFYGSHTVKAQQIGMMRDPMVAALFGARSAA